MSRRRILHLLNIMGRLAGGDWRNFLLRDDFTTNAAAPLASPRTAEPGPGTLTLIQTDGQFSISGGKLAFPAQTTPVVGDLTFYGDSQNRAAGRALVGAIRLSALASGCSIGLSTGAYVFYPTYGFMFDVAAITTFPTGVAGAALSLATDYTVAVVMRGTGAWLFIKGGIYTNWTLLHVVSTGTGALYPGFGNYNAAGTLDTFRVRDLPAPFDDDYGLATDRLAGAVSTGATFVHEANCVIEWTQTTLPSSSDTEVDFRRQDANNRWFVEAQTGGSLRLVEVVSGVETVRGATAAGIVANGHRIVVVADGTTIRAYSNNVLRITYSNANNFATETNGQMRQLGTGGAVSDLITWPRVLSGAAATYLDQAVA